MYLTIYFIDEVIGYKCFTPKTVFAELRWGIYLHVMIGVSNLQNVNIISLTYSYSLVKSCILFICNNIIITSISY